MRDEDMQPGMRVRYTGQELSALYGLIGVVSDRRARFNGRRIVSFPGYPEAVPWPHNLSPVGTRGADNRLRLSEEDRP